MRPPRLIFLVFCFIFFPIFLTLFSVLTSSSRVTTPSSFAGRATGLHALFSFNIPSSLFPPTAIISLTDDNSTFFLARPAAFGSLLPDKGLSGQLWIGSGFGDRTTAGAEGELGCSDIPGWGEGDSRRQDTTATADSILGKPVPVAGADLVTSNTHRTDPKQDIDSQSNPNDDASTPSTNDGTDDHLHHPLPESKVAEPGTSEQHGDNHQNRQSEHADIQSLQESAEINGNVVLLSRGGCGFLEKVKWVQRRGGIALIVGDDTRGGSLITMYARGDTSNVTIPALFTSYTTAHLLSSLVPPQAGGDSSVDDASGLRHPKLSSHNTPGKQILVPTTTSAAVVSPTSTRYVTSSGGKSATATHKAGFIKSLMSLLGIGRNSGRSGRLPEDSQRPPSSGNINWILKDQEIPGDGADRVHSRAKAGSSVDNRKKPDVVSEGADGDGFVIGVQDWRDPDLVAPISSSIPSPSSVPESGASKMQTTGKGSLPTSASLKGGSITPGSGEYHTLDKSKVSKADLQSASHQSLASHAQGYSTQSKGWFARHFSWRKGGDADLNRFVKRDSPEGRKLLGTPASQSTENVGQVEHEGLWVTLTPTSMSTSPFFDTLLILVVSPLLTLTVVYALLLLRSRIRRRRWRAPKSLVDRLPVRTYHTIPSSSSSTSSSSRSSSPGPVSQTSPLLGSRNRSGRRRPYETSKSTAEPKSPKLKSPQKEKSGSSSALWRRKYTGRQVECVVCLEEYVDGQSRVMSLPCGHEFHAECITPWLTTRRRTCPICKGDVVRSMSQNKVTETRESTEPVSYSHEFDSHSNTSAAPVPIMNNGEDEVSDLERHGSSDVGLLERHSSSAPPPNWRNFTVLNFSVLGGDSIWHQGRTDRER
ncbi:hypothetical protein BDV28DRAFT_133476 [Aspergillus coremiiformis]|uniref:RING-type E3 ubiquitin transferase n=1 Tax=Aspergillus coremiiformis TaxID=138285 RepID=A0A5N6Z940_9EURO|nr:hypothetical protein BDV28DRAFT_133476 [Aspergillus coremiiformis]